MRLPAGATRQTAQHDPTIATIEVAGTVQLRQASSIALAGSPYLRPKKRLTMECDEAWSFVGRKGHKRWIGLARHTREIVGGSRTAEKASGRSALGLSHLTLGSLC